MLLSKVTQSTDATRQGREHLVDLVVQFRHVQSHICKTCVRKSTEYVYAKQNKTNRKAKKVNNTANRAYDSMKAKTAVASRLTMPIFLFKTKKKTNFQGTRP
jgi:hypothetical protein